MGWKINEKPTKRGFKVRISLRIRFFANFLQGSIETFNECAFRNAAMDLRPRFSSSS